MQKTNCPSWLEDAVFYEIYPQSFCDSNGDGIGDLPGILEKLDYLQSLGVNALWLNPCFDSPFQDAGYDVRDYYKIAPRYGTNEDARALFAEAKRRGMHILLDLVPGHTSIEHDWFKASCLHERNEYTDWYIWTDSAWKWEIPGMRVISGYAERDGGYVTNFFYSQPALNYGFARPDPNQPWQQPVDSAGPRQVREAMHTVMKFWLDMGASGFRVDMAGWCVKADPDYKGNIQMWQEMREWLDKAFPQAVLVAEWGRPSIAIEAGFHVDFTLPFGMPGYTSLLRKPEGTGGGSDPYGFPFFDRGGRGNILEFLDDYLKHYTAVKGRGHIAIITGNHDINPRLNKNRTVPELELIYMFLMTMPGTPFIYYGDEIGMRTLDGLSSKEGGYNRTGSRTPMQWNTDRNAGFSSAPAGALYLPIDPSPERVNVSTQEPDPESLLNRVRRMIALRHAHPALHASADLEILHAEAGAYPLVYKRTSAGETLLVAINPAQRSVEVTLPGEAIPNEPEWLAGQKDMLIRIPGGWRLSLEGISGGTYKI